jgi:acyl carrier protein
MERTELLNELSNILKIPVENISGFEQLGATPSWDSFAHVEIMLLLEKEFNVELNEESMNEFSSMDRILKITD